jgi:hypothetical protein
MGTWHMSWSATKVGLSRRRVCDRDIRYFRFAPGLQKQPKGTRFPNVCGLFLMRCERLAKIILEGILNRPRKY